MKILVDKSLSPHGVTIAIVLNHYKMEALSPCCMEQIHYKMAGAGLLWSCSKCGSNMHWAKDHTSGASVYYLDSTDGSSNRLPIEEWVSVWTGIPVEDLNVRVER